MEKKICLKVLSTFAEMGNDIKNQISHRAEAVKKLTAFLSNYTF